MDSKKWLIVFNPKAGYGKAAKNKQRIINGFADASIPFELNTTSYSGHAKKITTEAIQNGYRNILSVGGDGTNNEVLNGICAQELVTLDNILFSNIPLGTGNDWARSYKLSDAIADLIKSIKERNFQEQDIGVATYYSLGQPRKQYFMNAAGLAYDAFVVKSLSNKRFKYFSRFVYLFYIMRLIFKYEPVLLKIKLDGKEIFAGRCYTVNVGNCRYCGGGLQITPHALPNDQLLALTIVKSMPVLQVFSKLLKLMNGKIIHDSMAIVSEGRTIEVISESDIFYLELDGEFAGEGPVKIELYSQSLHFLTF